MNMSSCFLEHLVCHTFHVICLVCIELYMGLAILLPICSQIIDRMCCSRQPAAPPPPPSNTMGKQAAKKRSLGAGSLAAQLDDSCTQSAIKKVVGLMKEKPAIVVPVSEIAEYLSKHPGEGGRLVSWVRSGVLEAKKAAKDVAVFSRSYTGLHNLPKMQFVTEMSQWGHVPKAWLDGVAKSGKQALFDLYCFSIHLVNPERKPFSKYVHRHEAIAAIRYKVFSQRLAKLAGLIGSDESIQSPPWGQDFGYYQCFRKDAEGKKVTKVDKDIPWTHCMHVSGAEASPLYY
jgi:hypothetical protein